MYSVGKNTKSTFVKNSKVALNKSTIEKINLLKQKKEKKEFGQKSWENSKRDNQKSGKKEATIKKTDWSQLKKEKKELRQKRKVKKINDDVVYDKIIQAKQISEKLRRSDCKSVDRVKLTQTLHDMLKNQYGKVIFAHDMSRVVQCMIKYCEEHVRQAIFHEIKPFIVEMLQSKYSKNCVKAILKYGSQEIRSEVISKFYGNIVKQIGRAHV